MRLIGAILIGLFLGVITRWLWEGQISQIANSPEQNIHVVQCINLQDILETYYVSIPQEVSDVEDFGEKFCNLVESFQNPKTRRK